MTTLDTIDVQTEVYVSLEFTPNPNTLKYAVNRTLLEKGGANFTQKDDAERRSPLASRLFGITGITGVMLGRDFVTISKSDEGDWDAVHKQCSNLIREHLMQNLPIFLGDSEADGHKGGNSEIELKIMEILDREIRPAVAGDGGDITFEKYENGIVYLYLQGSCAGCPSSTMTLKMGIETRLKKAIPEIQEVVSV